MGLVKIGLNAFCLVLLQAYGGQKMGYGGLKKVPKGVAVLGGVAVLELVCDFVGRSALL